MTDSRRWLTTLSSRRFSALPRRGPAFPARLVESPERVEAWRSRSTRGFSLSPESDLERLAKTDLQIAKNNQVFNLCSVRRWSTFPATSKGRPSDGAGSAGNRQEGRTGTTGNCQEGPPRCQRETSGNGWPPVERGSLGIVERPATSRSQDLQPLSGNGESGPRTAPPEASAKGEPDLSWVPGPTKNGIESPERVEASAKAPSGLSRAPRPLHDGTRLSPAR